MPKIKGVVFDLDGVLTNTEPVHQKADQKVLEKYGVKIDERWDQIRGLTQIDVFRTAVKMYNIDEDPEVLVEQKMIEFRKLMDEIRLFDGVTETLKWVRLRYDLALVSSSPRECVYAAVTKTGLHDFFDVILTGDDLIKGKPDPEPYKKAVALLGHQPYECVAVEDSVHGVKSAKSAGLYCVAITNTFDESVLKNAGADFIIRNIRELREILGKLDVP